LNGEFVETVANGGTVDLGDLAEGHYIVTAVVNATHNHTKAISTIVFDVIRYTGEVNITGIVNGSTLYAGPSFNVTVATNSTADISVFLNGEFVETVANGGTVDLKDLGEGHYVVTAVVNATHNHTKAISTIVFDVIRYTGVVNIAGLNVTVYAGPVFNVTVTTNSSGKINVSLNGKFIGSYYNGDTVVLGNLTEGNHIVTAIVEGTHNHTMANGSFEFTVNRYTAIVDITGIVNGSTLYAGPEFFVTVTTNSTAMINVTLNGKEFALVGNNTLVNLTDLPEGDYIVTAIVEGTHNHTKASKSVEFRVIRYAGEVNITGLNETVYAGPAFNVTVTSNGTGKINVSLNGKFIGMYANGSVVDLGALEAGVYVVTAVVEGTHNHTMANSSFEFTVYRYAGEVNITGIENTTYYVNSVFEVTVTTNSTSLINVTLNGKPVKVVANNAKVDLGDLAAGHYIVTASVEDTHNHTGAIKSVEFTVVKLPAPISINASDVKAGDAQLINVTVPDAATGLVLLDIDGKQYYANVTSGVAQFNITINAAGEYVAVATYEGNDIYLSNSTNISFNVSKVDGTVEVEIGDAVAGGNMVVKVTLPDDASGNVTVKIDNQTVITQEVKGGENTIVVSNVPEGTHNVTAVYSGDDKYESKTVTKVVVVNPSIIVSGKLTRAINSPYDYQAEFFDKDGNVLVDTDVQFVINGVTYTARTNFEGIARLTTSHLGLGDYDVTSINPATGQRLTKQLSIVPRLIENTNVVMDFYDGSKYVVKVIGDDGTPVGAGQFVRVYINGVAYPIETNKDGYAILPVTLNPGKYSVSVEYNGYIVKNTIKVKQTLKLVKKTIKIKKGKKLVLKAKLKWSNGKPIKGKKIVFKFKGKKYKAKTNKKGIAKVTIKKKVTKKLKKGKKYKFSATYITNTVKGKVKIKK
jgi:hypothetical protein